MLKATLVFKDLENGEKTFVSVKERKEGYESIITVEYDGYVYENYGSVDDAIADAIDSFPYNDGYGYSLVSVAKR